MNRTSDWDDVFTIVCDVAKYYDPPVDEFCEEITDNIVEDNGAQLTENEVRELAEQYFTEEEDDE